MYNIDLSTYVVVLSLSFSFFPSSFPLSLPPPSPSPSPSPTPPSLKVFDLKGSMRSRYIDPSKDSSSDVLLDENFLNRKITHILTAYNGCTFIHTYIIHAWLEFTTCIYMYL